MLGADGIFVELAGEAHELRPSLRTCTRLVRRHGLSGLLAAVQDFDVIVIMDVLRETAIKPSLLLAEIAAIGLGPVRHRLTNPLAEFVLAVAGIDPDDTTPSAPATGTPMTPTEAFARLFGIATGWLGWTPEEAWNATPIEIIAAQSGRTDLITDVLKAVFGTTDQKTTAAPYTPDQLAKIEQDGHDPAFDRSGLAAMKGKLQCPWHHPGFAVAATSFRLVCAALARSQVTAPARPALTVAAHRRRRAAITMSGARHALPTSLRIPTARTPAATLQPVTLITSSLTRVMTTCFATGPTGRHCVPTITIATSRGLSAARCSYNARASQKDLAASRTDHADTPPQFA